jgi:hypothetical protein
MMTRIAALLLPSWIIDILLLLFADSVFVVKEFLILWLLITIPLPIFLMALSRRLAGSRMVIRLYDDGREMTVPCPDCTGGQQLLGKPMPQHLGMDQGWDEHGPFFNPPQANVHACRTCNGRNWLLTTREN